jgi:hypothetical protein
MKKLWIITLLFFGTHLISADKVVPFIDLVRPGALAVGQHRLYVADGPQIYIFSIKDFKLKRKFGREGEGPQEFKRRVYLIDIHEDHIMVNSYDKVSYFTKDGEFKRELKAPPSHMRFRALGKKFAGFSVSIEKGTMYRTLNIYDSNLAKEKEVCRLKHEVQAQSRQGTSIFAKALSADIWLNRLFIAVKEDLTIDVFDENGQHVYSIKRDYQRIKVTEKDKQKVMNYLKTDPETKQYFEMLKPIKFPTLFPAVREMITEDQNVYAVTYRNEEGKHELFIFNIDGKFQGKAFIPIKLKNAVDFYPFTIKNEQLYQLIENEETEEWNLHITKIK